MASVGKFINKVAIVTGASSGLGQAAAILLANEGASVVLCGRDKDRLKTSVDQCVVASGGNTKRFTSVEGDVTKQEVRKAIIDTTVNHFNRLDILVANAGLFFPENGLESVSEELYDKTFDTNVKSVFFLIQTALPHLETSGGNVVIVSSISSAMALRGRPVYSMTKAAVDHMTRSLALDLAVKGIRVNAVNPSYFPTRLRRAFGDDVESIAQRGAELESENQPLYGKCVTPEAIADTIAFLASDAAKFVTGQCHIVDGGRCFLGVQ